MEGSLICLDTSVLKNKLIALPDSFIASISVFNDVPLATLNKKDFERVPSLQLV